jgi:hypothetical protein
MLAVIVQIALVLQLPVDAPVRLLGLTLTIDPLGRLVMLTILGVALFSYVVTFFIAHGENFVPVSLLILGITNATVLLMQEPFVASLLMVSSGLLAILAIVDLPSRKHRARRALTIDYRIALFGTGTLVRLCDVHGICIANDLLAYRTKQPRLTCSI